MMPPTRLALFALATLFCGASFTGAQTATAPKTLRTDADVPAPKKDTGRFMKMHESFLARAQSGPVDLLFLGDSITAGWTKAPDVWKRYYGKYNPANFGIGGDGTHHVLWRITNGELDHINPKVVVLMIGTNNSGAYTAESIIKANRAIIDVIKEKLPKTKVLLLAIFPRGPRTSANGVVDDFEGRMTVIDEVNAALAKFDDGKTVRFLNINHVFLDKNGKIPEDIMPDQLHPVVKGYELWAEAMHPLLQEMMKD
jgi:lysophospholipase L1-like esterase